LNYFGSCSPGIQTKSISFQVSIYTGANNKAYSTAGYSAETGRRHITGQFLYFNNGNGIFSLFIRPEKLFFNNFLRIFLSEMLAETGGFLIHSAGVSHKNEGLLFSGLSGSGKTTTARKFKKIFSDDIVGIKKDKDRYLLFPTPFWGELPLSEKLLETKPVVIKNVFFLNKPSAGTSLKILDFDEIPLFAASADRRFKQIFKALQFRIFAPDKTAILKTLLRNIIYFGNMPGRLLGTAVDFIEKCTFFYLTHDID
jgi:hypothetical protein